MTAAAPTFSQIRAHVAAIRQKVHSARVIGIRSTGRWTGSRERCEGQDIYLIDQCDSPLAMRLALREGNETATHILVTPLDDKDLGDDILVRLTKRRLFAVDSWQIVRSLFLAQTVDPRLTRHNWIADYLMDAVPADGYPPASGGFLDAETVWPIVLGRAIGLTVDRPDLQTLLKWSIDTNDVARYRTAPEAFRQAASEWLATLAGPAAQVVLQCVGCHERPDAAPIGLAAGVVFHQSAEGTLEKATGKLEERYLGGLSPSNAEIQRWNAAATEVVRVHLNDPGVRRQLLQRADDILREIGAESFAHLSDTSPLGFRMCQATKRILAGDKNGGCWSRRAQEQINSIRGDFPWLDRDSTVVLDGSDDQLTWWTFGGNGGNATLANELAQITRSQVEHNDFALTFDSQVRLKDVQSAIEQLRGGTIDDMRPAVDERAIDGLKFSECLPRGFAIEMLQLRLRDIEAVGQTLQSPMRFVSAQV